MPLHHGILPGVVELPGTVEEGIVVLCGTCAGSVVVPGMVLLGTLLLFGFEPCGKFPGMVVRGTAFGSVGVTGTVDGCVVVRGDVELDGVDTLLGTVLDGTVDGCVVGLDVAAPGVATPGVATPGRSDGCTMAPGTVLGCVVLPGLADGCVAPVAGRVPEGVADGVVVCANALPNAIPLVMANAMIFN